MTSILKEPVIDENYKKYRIQIAFNPTKEKFEVFNPVIGKNKAWIPDIGPIVDNKVRLRKIGDEYVKANPDSNIDQVDTLFKSISIFSSESGGLNMQAVFVKSLMIGTIFYLVKTYLL